MGLGFVYFSQSEQTAYNALGDSAGSFSAGDMALSAAYAGALGRLLLGGGAKVIRSSIDNVSGSAVAFDFGAQFLRLTEAGDGPVDVGCSVFNLGSPLKLGQESDPLPFHIRTGVLWHTTPYLKTAFDYNLPVDNDPYLTMGLEGHVPLQRPKPWKALFRGGYNLRYSRKVEGLSGLALGAGLDFERFFIDYAWVPFGDIGTTNRFWLGYRFEWPAPVNAPAASSPRTPALAQNIRHSFWAANAPANRTTRDTGVAMSKTIPQCRRRSPIGAAVNRPAANSRPLTATPVPKSRDTRRSTNLSRSAMEGLDEHPDREQEEQHREAPSDPRVLEPQIEPGPRH